MPMSNQTHHALKVIRDYLEGENEAVQYELEFMADQVSQSSSGIIGGFQAGNVPSNDVVTDNSPQVFELNASPTSWRGRSGTPALLCPMGSRRAVGGDRARSCVLASAHRVARQLPG
jgi:hypothetical protein